ncbi:MAG: HD domain-containing protein [Desulfobacteraceae bacterium]|nr:HD domain-containing protein [Desulfobacteraceae bacterium]MDH3573243.1 HD domain-containing protein [Desulfobacteraceae bacterium]MDH3721087.1 HD domain-containing protein [Desulfobacteraceae bacterium]MDH3837602.1 HD domain-containing protein [Desulfobacteraceae bacterium]MDH3873585.1 HD domain-containing protein [Desulfobacteraceae bacterium]
MDTFKDQNLNVISLALKEREAEILSPVATLSNTGMRRVHDARLEEGYRQTFSVDVDRILHSRAYTRYIDKTQVFYLIHHDHITHRVLHVQLVSKIARSIGRYLGLNEDLIEAIALGHDIGHTPFGHDGERFLSELCRASGIGDFHHNVQSVQFLDRVERKGKGWNLCLQTLDGILCHDGEVHNQILKPERNKTFEMLENEMVLKKENPLPQLMPMTLEGCVVRMADTISYIGRDIEDAIRLNMIKRSDLPKESVDVLGNTNGTIVYHLVTDVINTSFQNTYIAFSQKISEALKRLKDFNLERIYMNPKIKKETDTIKTLFGILFEKYLDDIENENRSSVIFKGFLEDMSEDYIQNHCKEEIVRDFIAGMTDQYFLRQCPEDMRPEITSK